MWDAPALPFVVAVPLFLLIGYTLVDIFRRADLSGIRKALWAVLVIVVPVIGTFIYLVSRPFRDPAHVTLRGNERTHKIVELIGDHAAGAISDEEFASAKHRVFDEAVATNRAAHE